MIILFKLFIPFLLGFLNNVEFISACMGEQDQNPLLSFETTLIELGKVKRGEVKEFQFDFVNKGKEDVEIEFISSCDCTTLDYPSWPIAPGEKGSIKVIFDSTEKTESETVDIDIDLVNKDPKTDRPIFIRINYSFILVE